MHYATNLWLNLMLTADSIALNTLPSALEYPSKYTSTILCENAVSLHQTVKSISMYFVIETKITDGLNCKVPWREERRREGGREGGRGDTLAGEVKLSHPPPLHSPIHSLTHSFTHSLLSLYLLYSISLPTPKH